jgi:adenylosuccinate synthase
MERIDYEDMTDRFEFVPDAITLRKASQGRFIEMPGWKEDIRECKSIGNLPWNTKSFISKLEDLLGIPIDVSVGPDREETIIPNSYWELIN